MSRRIAWPLVFFGSGLLLASTSGSAPPENRQASPPAVPVLQALGGNDRYLTYVSTDKPIYRPGETLFMRGVPCTTSPASRWRPTRCCRRSLKSTGPREIPSPRAYAPLQESVFGFSWTIPAVASRRRVHDQAQRPVHRPAARRTKVRRSSLSRSASQTQIKFLRDGYGPGDEVVAIAECRTGRRGRAGRCRRHGHCQGGRRGNVSRSRHDRRPGQLPGPIQTAGPEIRRGEGTLAMVIEDGGVVETASKTIPILLANRRPRDVSRGGRIGGRTAESRLLRGIHPRPKAGRPGGRRA